MLAPQLVDGRLTWADLDNDGVNGLITPLPVVTTEDPSFDVKPQHVNNHGEVALVVQWFDEVTWQRWQRGFLLIPNHCEVYADGGVTIEYPAADLDGDGLNDYLIDLGAGVRVQDEAKRPLSAIVINDQGDVAGKVWNDWLGEVNGERPFVLRPRVDENLGLLNRQYDVTDPRAVNALGQVVGRSLRYTHDAVYQQGWLWDQGTMVPLSELVPGLADAYSIASGINDSAMIVGATHQPNPQHSRLMKTHTIVPGQTPLTCHHDPRLGTGGIHRHNPILDQLLLPPGNVFGNRSIHQWWLARWGHLLSAS